MEQTMNLWIHQINSFSSNCRLITVIWNVNSCTTPQQVFPRGSKPHTGSDRLLLWFSPIQKVNHLQEGRNLMQLRSWKFKKTKGLRSTQVLLSLSDWRQAANPSNREDFDLTASLALTVHTPRRRLSLSEFNQNENQSNQSIS